MAYARRELALQAARTKLGSNAREGKHFYVKKARQHKRWTWGVLTPGRTYPWTGRFTSRQEVDSYFETDTLTCLLCGAPFDHLSRHVLKEHGLTSREYKRRFDLPMKRGLISSRVRHKFRYSAEPALRAIRDKRIQAIGRASGPRSSERPDWCRTEQIAYWRAGLKRWLLKQSIDRHRTSGREILARARRALPSALPSDMRDEIAQEMAVAVCSGTLAVSDIESAARNFLVSFNRDNRGKYGTLSLDAPLYTEGRATLGDRIASDAFHF